MNDSSDRLLVRDRLKQFIAAAIEKAGGPKALGLKLERHGFSGRQGPFDERTVRAWRSGHRLPSPDLVFAIANLFELSIDRFAFDDQPHNNLAQQIARLNQDRDQLMAWMLEVRENLGFPPPHLPPLTDQEEQVG